RFPLQFEAYRLLSPAGRRRAEAKAFEYGVLREPREDGIGIAPIDLVDRGVVQDHQPLKPGILRGLGIGEVELVEIALYLVATKCGGDVVEGPGKPGGLDVRVPALDAGRHHTAGDAAAQDAELDLD